MKQPFARFVCDEQTGKNGRMTYGRTWSPRKKARWLVKFWVLLSKVGADDLRNEREVKISAPVRFADMLTGIVQPQADAVLTLDPDDNPLPDGYISHSIGFTIWEL